MAKKTQKPFRLAFIGAGAIAGAHLKALKELPSVEVVALADIKTDPMDKYAEDLGLAPDRCYSDYKKMLRDVKPDAVDICTPNSAHAACSIAASKAGAHVIVEKPMAMNAGQCRKMIAAAKQAKKKLVIGFQFRYSPKTQFLHKQAQAGALGEILYGRVQALRRRGIPNWGVFGQKALQGGGPMIDIGVHTLEMAHYVMGNPKPVAASGMTRTYLGNKKSATQVACQWPGWDHRSYDVEDLAIGHIRFENGAVIHVEASFAAHIEKDIWDFQLMGTQGGCRWDDSQIFTDHHGYQTNTRAGFLPEYNVFHNGFVDKLSDFVDHCTKGTPSQAPAEHGLMVQQMLDGVYRSAEAGGKEVMIR